MTLRILILITISFQTLMAQSLVQVYSYVFSDYYDEKLGEWRPSECDCDYESGELCLYPNQYFTLELQKGRLDAINTKIDGKWAIQNDTILYLYYQVDEEKRSSTEKVAFNPILTNDNSPLIYYIRGKQLFDGRFIWRCFS